MYRESRASRSRNERVTFIQRLSAYVLPHYRSAWDFRAEMPIPPPHAPSLCPRARQDTIDDQLQPESQWTLWTPPLIIFARLQETIVLKSQIHTAICHLTLRGCPRAWSRLKLPRCGRARWSRTTCQRPGLLIHQQRLCPGRRQSRGTSPTSSMSQHLHRTRSCAPRCQRV